MVANAKDGNVTSSSHLVQTVFLSWLCACKMYGIEWAVRLHGLRKELKGQSLTGFYKAARIEELLQNYFVIANAVMINIVLGAFLYIRKNDGDICDGDICVLTILKVEPRKLLCNFLGSGFYLLG